MKIRKIENLGSPSFFQIFQIFGFFDFFGFYEFNFEFFQVYNFETESEFVQTQSRLESGTRPKSGNEKIQTLD